MDKAISINDIRQAVGVLGLTGRPLCLHASLRSFGWVEGGGAAVVDALLAEGCTVMVASFSDGFAVSPPPHMRPMRNGWNYDESAVSAKGNGRIYAPDTNEIDREMGAVAAAVVNIPSRVRGNHPLNSFSAIGTLAHDLIAGQEPLNVYAPLERLSDLGGFVVLMGVGLKRLTLLHLAEKRAGRNLFRRWANGPDGRPIAVEAGGCSDGFPRFEPLLAPLVRKATVGRSAWTVLPAAEALAAALAAIRVDPSITHCGDPACGRCRDAVLGGPLV